MWTSSHRERALHAAADRVRARRFWNAAVAHLPALIRTGVSRPGDAERYYMAWLSVHAFTTSLPRPTAAVKGA